jgi:threonylcarbamoyladenosine tRNA methylthiotransferase MtaB
MRVAFVTFGCKINQYDTDVMRHQALAEGSSVVPFDSEADVYVINTCSVTGKADYQCRQAIRAAVRRGAGARIVVTGCYAETRPDDIRGIDGVTHVLGNSGKPTIASLLAAEVICTHSDHKSGRTSLPRQRTRGVLKVQDGCDGSCSYCIVPHARGASRSVPAADLFRTFDQMIVNGVPEVVISGIHIGRYGVDLRPSTTLSALVLALAQRKRQARIRLSSIEPGEVTPEITAMLGKGICRHLHIPLQSGDDRILHAMNRQYSAAEYRALLESIAAAVPDVALGADVIVGFPGEDDPAFENTRRLIESLPLTHLHVFSFSPRPGTAAAVMPHQVPEKVKKERNGQLRELGLRKNRAFRTRLVGKKMEIVVEDVQQGSLVSGLTDNYVRVELEDGKEGSISGQRTVTISEVSLEGTRGSLADN